ncbi:MAG TPA: AAA family ATPase [Azonexus sp.]|nr:AAA family ATPase [Azonexus sp.]
MNGDFSLKRPALYNPALWSRDEVRTYYVARPKILARLLDDFRREQAGTRPQHRLILGQRGMGKSTLLRRLAIGVEDDAELAGQWLPLNFPEEQYNVATQADFWLNCLDALGDWLEARGEIAEMQALDAEIERLDRKDGEGALQTLLRLAAKLQRRLLLLVDNIDLILERLKDKDWALREALQEHPELLLIGASSRALEATYDYGAAFYDFFRIDELRGLSEEEMRETIVNLARLRGAEELICRLDDDPGRLRVLHTLTGGNPRTAVLLYGVLLKGMDGDVRSDLEGLLDEVTPLYKARFDELPAQAQQLLDKLALHWDPMSARQVADTLGWPVNQASAQLDRLVQAGVVEKVKSGRGKRMAFQVAERFFNIWYLMRASRRVRRKLMWLVEFLRVFFNSDELQRLAKDGLQTMSNDARNAEFQLALCRALGPIPLARALETRALESLLLKHGVVLEEILDVGGEDRDLADKAKQINNRKTAGEILNGICAKCEFSSAAELLLSLPISSELILKIAEVHKDATLEEYESLTKFVEETVGIMRKLYGELGYTQLSEAVVAGYLKNPRDSEGGEAASVGLGFPLLSIIPQLYRRRELSAAAYETLSREALRLDDTGALYWLSLAEALAQRGQQEEAKESAKKARNLAPDDSDLGLRIADVLAICGESEEAERLYRLVTSCNPKNLDALLGLVSLLHLNSSRIDEANALARKACDLASEDSRTWFALALTMPLEKHYASERLAALRRADALSKDRSPTLALILAHQLALGSESEVRQAAEDYFKFLGAYDTEGSEIAALKLDTELMCQTLRVAVFYGASTTILAEFDKTEAAQRFRVVREALHAVVTGSVAVLDELAPEVRKPALEVLAIIAPTMVTTDAVVASI